MHSKTGSLLGSPGGSVRRGAYATPDATTTAATARRDPAQDVQRTGSAGSFGANPQTHEHTG
jgi:hypothetical protein